MARDVLHILQEADDQQRACIDREVVPKHNFDFGKYRTDLGVVPGGHEGDDMVSDNRYVVVEARGFSIPVFKMSFPIWTDRHGRADKPPYRFIRLDHRYRMPDTGTRSDSQGLRVLASAPGSGPRPAQDRAERDPPDAPEHRHERLELEVGEH